ncbi:uncharacterized protein [Engystomops pustulosus]|uniref:uncharacterized protein n=1 Tax=Engystomops pustulosus TaxID=76066 RepID=UPI003AFB73DA
MSTFPTNEKQSLPDNIAPPILRASPHYDFYYKGESVTLTCNTPSEYLKAHFSFYKNSECIPTDNTTIYNIQGMDYSDIGKYYCDFWSGKSSSPRSNEILLLFSDTLPAPVISLSPSLPVYRMGESVTIICSLPKSWQKKKIEFYKEGNLQPVKREEENTYVISTSNKEVAGRYFCTYTTEISETLITSLPSNYITVNISVSAAQTTKATAEATTMDETSKTEEMEESSLIQSTTSTNVAKTTRDKTVWQTSVFDVKNKTTEAVKSFSQVFLYIFAGCLICISIAVIIIGVVHIYISQKGKREDPMVELSVHSIHNLEKVEQSSLHITELQEMETHHYYSEIELPVVKPTHPNATFYSRAKAIDSLPFVYQTDMSTHASK